MPEEPVGNQPRKHPAKDPNQETGMSAIKGNSHKERLSSTESTEEREPVEKIVEGRVVARKLPWYKKFARSMIADDANNVGEYVLGEVVIPAAKNLIVAVISESIERVLFGTSRGRIGRRSPLGASLRDQFDYGKFSRDREPPRTMSRRARATHDFQEIVLENRSEAEEVVELLIARIIRYGAVSVADLYDAVGTTGSYADQRWGWTDLNTADVRQVPGGFLLDLPAPEPILR